MPIVDMPLEQLKVYQGRNPRPADFDEFWDKSLAEMNALDPKAEFKPFDFPSNIADAYELTFTGTKDARIYARFMKPKKVNGKIPAVLIFHGLSGSADDWSGLLQHVAEGYCVAALDCRGQGGRSADAGSKFGTTYSTPFMRGFDGAPEELYCRDLYLDTALLAKIVMGLDYVDETRVAALGGSQGGGLSIACASLVPEIKLCAPMYPYLSDYKRVWEMDLDKGAYDGLRYYLRHFDPRHERIDEIFEKLGYIDIQFLAPRIKAKVMMATGLLDTICPPSTQFAAYNKITSEKKVVIYPDYGHEGLKGHNDIVFRFLKEL